MEKDGVFLLSYQVIETIFEIIDARQWFSGNTQDTMK